MLYSSQRKCYSVSMINENRKAAIALRLKGFSVREIAIALKITRARVYQLLDTNYNISRRKLFTGADKMLDKDSARV